MPTLPLNATPPHPHRSPVRSVATLLAVLVLGPAGPALGEAPPAASAPAASQPADVTPLARPHGFTYGGAGPITAVATVGMVADLVRQVGGDRVQVTGLMGEGVDPHLYKASPGDVARLSRADIIFFAGLHLEGKLGEVLEKLARRKPCVAVSEALPVELRRSADNVAGQYDPHVWFDVSLWSAAAQAVCDALVEFDPAHAEGYKARTAAYRRQLADLHAWCQRELAAIPPAQRVLVTAHDAFGYFGRAYAVEVLAIQGVSTDSQAGLTEINRLVDLLATRGIKAVFVESSVPHKTVESLVEGCKARGHAVRIGGELFSDAMGPAGSPEGTYIGMVQHNVRTIVAALK